MTKIWYCKLKPGHDVNDKNFCDLWTEVLGLCSSYTNPEAGSPTMHALYQSVDNPSQLIMLSGYPSTELNVECDKVYASKYMPKMFEFVQHVWLRQLELDIRSLPMDSKRITLTCGSSPDSQGQGVGGWDVWQSSDQAKQNLNNAQGEREGEGQDERIWVEISALTEPVQEQGVRARSERFVLNFLMGR
jgi:hypothetical protein